MRLFWMVVALFVGLFIYTTCEGADLQGMYVMQKGNTSSVVALGDRLEITPNLYMHGNIQTGIMWYEHQDRDYRGGIFGGVAGIGAKYGVLYVEASTGIGYVKGDTRIKSGLCGIVDGTAGFDFNLHEYEYIGIFKGLKVVEQFRIGYAFKHVSSLKPGDKGANMHGVVLGVRW